MSAGATRSLPAARRLDELLEAAIEEGAFPGAVMLVRDARGLLYLRAAGWRAREPGPLPMTVDTAFDLSSLTKALATSTAVMMLVDRGALGLETELGEMLGRRVPADKREIRVRDLLAHCSGLPPWRPLYRGLSDCAVPAGEEGRRALLDRAVARILAEPLDAVPGTTASYSDLGFILLGAVVERACGMALDRFCEAEVFTALALRRTGFRRTERIGVQRCAVGPVAATERCPWRRRVLCGEVHDENAWALGGVAGHAGLFSTAAEVDRLLCALRAAWAGSGDTLVRPATVRRFWEPDGRVSGSTWRLGWDGPATAGSAAGTCFPPSAVGHLGFTGTSVWLDPQAGRHVVLLTNRVHPRRDNEAIRHWRPLLHDAAANLWEGMP